MNGKDTLTLVDTVNADTTEEYRYDITKPGAVTGLVARTYVGQEFALRYRFTVEREAENSTDLVKSLGKQYLAGNGEDFKPDIREEVKPGDTVVIEVENATGRDGAEAYQYHANAEVGIDYDGGAFGLLAGFLS